MFAEFIGKYIVAFSSCFCLHTMVIFHLRAQLIALVELNISCANNVVDRKFGAKIRISDILSEQISKQFCIFNLSEPMLIILSYICNSNCMKSVCFIFVNSNMHILIDKLIQQFSLFTTDYKSKMLCIFYMQFHHSILFNYCIFDLSYCYHSICEPHCQFTMFNSKIGANPIICL